MKTEIDLNTLQRAVNYIKLVNDTPLKDLIWVERDDYEYYVNEGGLKEWEITGLSNLSWFKHQGIIE